MTWLPAPTHDGLWWLASSAAPTAEPVRVEFRAGDAARFDVAFLGCSVAVPDEKFTGGAAYRWAAMAPPPDGASAPDPTEHGAPGERVARHG